MGRVERITRELQSFDHKLFCDKNAEGTLRICRKTLRYELYDVDGQEMIFARPAYHVIFYLTNDWTIRGRDVEWGVLPILKKLRECDSHQRDMANLVEKQAEEQEKSNDRFLDNYTEAFCKENRRAFAKETDGIITSNLNKKKDKRWLEEKKIKNR